MDLIASKKDKNKNDEYQFNNWKLCLKNAGVKTIEELYKKIFAEIRKNADRPAGKKRKDKKKAQKKIVRDSSNVSIVTNGKHKYRSDVRLNNQQRKDRVAAKINKFVEERKKAMASKKK